MKKIFLTIKSFIKHMALASKLETESYYKIYSK